MSRPRAQEPDPDSIAGRLDYLFKKVHPHDRGPYTPGEVAALIAQRAGREVLTGSYLIQLRRGSRTNPTVDALRTIGDFFGVPISYFVDAPRDGHAKQKVAIKQEVMTPPSEPTEPHPLDTLSPESQEVVWAMIHRLQDVERVPSTPTRQRGMRH